jgi:hypothetical protein
MTMKRKDGMKIDSDLDENLEEKLEGILNPVAPRSSYVTELQNRLTKPAEISVEYPNYLIFILVLSSGFVLGALFLAVLGKLYRLLSGTNVKDE